MARRVTVELDDFVYMGAEMKLTLYNAGVDADTIRRTIAQFTSHVEAAIGGELDAGDIKEAIIAEVEGRGR